MKEFFSNAWVISIISGIFVFFITNFFIMVQNKKQNRKKIYEANTMILNHLRSYVVDNGLPDEEIIEAVKHSVTREYRIKYDDLLSTKSFCEELVADIIGNIYISNENKIKYINMLQEYLKKNKNIQSNNTYNIDDKVEIKLKKENDNKKNIFSFSYKYEFIISMIPAFVTAIATIVMYLTIKPTNNLNNRSMMMTYFITFLVFIVPQIIEWFNNKK